LGQFHPKPPRAYAGNYRHAGSGAFSPDGTRLYCTTVSFGGVEVIDLTTRSLIENIFIPSTTTQVHLNGISISPDGNTAWVIDFTSNSVLALNLISKQVVASIAFGSATPIGIASTNDGSKLYVADLDGAQVFVIDTSSLSVVRTIPVGIFPEALRFSPDGTELWIAITGGTQIIDPTTDAVIATIQLPSLGSATGVAFHPSGQWVYLAGGWSGQGAGPIVIDRLGKQIQKILTTGEQTWDVAVAADGSTGFTANSDGTITVLNTIGNSVNGSVTIGSVIRNVFAWQPTVPAIVLYGCVTTNHDGTYTASFSYNSSSGRTLFVPIGEDNSFSAVPADRGQPTAFLAGGSKNAFTVNFDGNPITWSVQTPLGLTSSVTLSSTSKDCK